tara:strand:+ start:573 stop:1082 length:510 start_codon:yes stop_codon:yes gene_type:complete
MALHSIKFWDFSTRLYEMSGVAEICLELQDQLNLDVNIVLFCFWGAHIEEAPTELQWEEIIEFSRDWKKNLVQPLRSVRNSLKREINNYPSTKGFETLRKRVKSDELAAEQIQQDIIQSKVETTDLKFQPFSRSDAMKHLAYYLAGEGIVLTDDLKNKLDEIAKNVNLM